jgi:hypothetical protein
MKLTTKNQKGSPSRDRFKLLHKQLLPGNCWALDSDLELVEKRPIPFVVARLDFKMGQDSISFTEAIAYQHYLSAPMPYKVPVYIIEANPIFKDENSDPKDHLFAVIEVTALNYRPDPPTYDRRVVIENATWQDLADWEAKLRNERQRQIALYLQSKVRP